MLIYNAEIHTMDSRGVIENGWLEVEEGKIKALGEGSPEAVPEDSIDACGGLLLPGFIEAHTHLGIIADGLDFEGDDCNESTDPFTPQMRAIDGINPFDRCFEEARMRGVTAAASSPGSANACGGEIAAIKTYGRRIDDMLIRNCGIKFALGENPKNVYNGREETPVTRMAITALIREGLYKARRYVHDMDSYYSDSENYDPPEYDIKCEALMPLLDRKIKAFFHCHRADDICTAMRISKEFSLDPVIIHGTEGYKIADILGLQQPTMGYFSTDIFEGEMAHARFYDEEIRKQIPKCSYRKYTISEILNSMIRNGFVIKQFDEHPSWVNENLPGEFTAIGIKD